MFLIDLLLNLSEEFPMNYNNAPTVITVLQTCYQNTTRILFM